MIWGRLRSNGNESVFKGSQLVTSILERHSGHFRSRATALKFCRQLFNDGVIKGVFGADNFEDSVQLYAWQDQNGSNMTSSYKVNKTPQWYGYSSADVTIQKRDLHKQKNSIKHVESSKETISNGTTSYSHEINPGPYSRNVPSGDGTINDNRMEHLSQPHMNSYQTSWNLQRTSTASSESSVDLPAHSYGKYKEKNAVKIPFINQAMTTSRDHDVIPEEAQEEAMMERTGTSTEYEGSSSIPRSVATEVSNFADSDGMAPQRRWQQDIQNSYSDNEKQLIEQMKRMKKEHSHILRNYEDRINKLMVKMHELRNIAEMLENSSTKSSPYGMITNRNGVLNFLSSKTDNERKPVSVLTGNDADNPPPLPPRPGRGSRLNPHKPQVRTDAKMKPLQWTRIILRNDSTEEPTTLWHTMTEPILDAEEIERLFSCPLTSQTDGATLYDDLIIRRGRSRQQLVSIYDSERSKKIVICMKCLRATLNEVVSSVSSLDTSQTNHEGLAELLELLAPVSDIDKILNHVRKDGAGHLDHPEYLVFELSKVDHFKDRLEFIRFRFKLLWHLFEIDQQMRELHTACDEVTSSTSLKNLLETLLVVGNYLNSSTELGQADGFHLDVLNKLKGIQDRDGKGTLLEFVLKTYCQIYENEVDIGCPTRFRLPEPSNMRHAAQVSFEGIQDALTNLHSDLRHVREQLLDPKLNKDTMRPMDIFRVTAENFFASALEVIGEQEKVLQNTRDLFDKTVALYLIDKQSVTPQYFFNMWAVFLHDCKYFWKLSHRRIAKERFELEFKYKGQVSACSLNGYGTFRAGVMIGADSSNPTDPKTSTQQRKASRWSTEQNENSKPHVPPKPSYSVNVDKEPVSDRSQSPKPLTSIPPTSGDVHKPMPKTLVPNGHLPYNTPYVYSPNYENQSELERYQQNTQVSNFSRCELTADNIPQTTIVHPLTSPENMQPKDKRSSQQFSLKTWLKREREQVRKGIEGGTVENEKKPQHSSSSKPFRKFKSTMMQKFSGTLNKKNEPSLQKTKDSKHPQNSPDLQTDQKLHDVNSNNYTGDHNSFLKLETSPAVHDLQVYNIHSDYNGSFPEAVISPIDDPDIEESSLPYKQSSPPRMAVNASISTTKFNDRNDHRIGTHGDAINNNRIGNSEKVGVVSPMSDNRQNDVGVHGQLTNGHTPDKGTHNFTQFSPVQTGNCSVQKRVSGPAASVYKASYLNNYENQGKLDDPDAIRHWAEPAKPLPVAIQQDSVTAHSNLYRRDTDIHSSNKYGYESSGNRETNDSNSVNQTSHLLSESNPYGGHFQLSKGAHIAASVNDMPRKTSAFESKSCFTPENRQQPFSVKPVIVKPTRVQPTGIQPVGSLIEKFDKYNNGNPFSVSASNPKAIPVSQTTAIISTQVAAKLPMPTDRGDKTPPLPPRKNITPMKSNTTEVPPEGHRFNLSYRSQEKLPNSLSAQSRLDNLTQGHISPSKSYYTPPGNKPYSQSNQSANYYNFTTPVVETADISKGLYTTTPDMNTPRINKSSTADDQQLSNGNLGYLDKSDDRDDGYRAKLRKAANSNQYSYDRPNKPTPQYSGGQNFGSPYSKSGLSACDRSNTHNNNEVSYMAI